METYLIDSYGTHLWHEKYGSISATVLQRICEIKKISDRKVFLTMEIK